MDLAEVCTDNGRGYINKCIKRFRCICLAELVQALKTGNSQADMTLKDDGLQMLILLQIFWEVEPRIAGDYAQNIALNDQIEPQALGMADVMTMGIVQQFSSLSGLISYW